MKKNIITFSKSGASSSKIRNIKWNAKSNLDNFTKSGQYYITGYRASGTDSLPISNIGEWHNISALLTVTDSGEADTQQRNRIVGQTLILSNRVGGETKIFTRSCNMVSGGGLWTAWSTVQGLREVGGVSPVDIASYTDSGLYSGAITDSELSTMPMMPGTTFLLVVINNSQLASLSGSSQVRACTQLMYVLPYSHNASLDGISEGSIYLRTGMRSDTTGIYEWGDWNSYDNRLQLIEKQLAELNLSGDVKGVISDDGSIVTSINPQAPIMQEITMVLNILLEAHDGSDNIKSTMRQYVGTAVSEMVDEEDITIDDDNLLRLKNRSYSKGVGMGYVILRRGKSFASQVTAANTIYEIRYDFDLAGEEVAIPEGCTLKFEGGRLIGGTLKLCNTKIVADESDYIFENLNIIGTTMGECFVDWFGALRNGVEDCSSNIQRAFDSAFGEIRFGIGFYYITATINVSAPKNVVLAGEQEASLKKTRVEDDKIHNYFQNAAILWTDKNIEILSVQIIVEESVSYENIGFTIRGGVIDVSRCDNYSVSVINLCRSAYINMYPHISSSIVSNPRKLTINSTSAAIRFYEKETSHNGCFYGGSITSYISGFGTAIRNEIENIWITNIFIDLKSDRNITAVDLGISGNSGGEINGWIQTHHVFNVKENRSALITGNLRGCTITCHFWDLQLENNKSLWTNEYAFIMPNNIKERPYIGGKARHLLRNIDVIGNPLIIEDVKALRNLNDYTSPNHNYIEFVSNNLIGIKPDIDVKGAVVNCYSAYTQLVVENISDDGNINIKYNIASNRRFGTFYFKCLEPATFAYFNLFTKIEIIAMNKDTEICRTLYNLNETGIDKIVTVHLTVNDYADSLFVKLSNVTVNDNATVVSAIYTYEGGYIENRYEHLITREGGMFNSDATLYFGDGRLTQEQDNPYFIFKKDGAYYYFLPETYTLFSKGVDNAKNELISKKHHVGAMAFFYNGTHFLPLYLVNSSGMLCDSDGSLIYNDKHILRYGTFESRPMPEIVDGINISPFKGQRYLVTDFVENGKTVGRYIYWDGIKWIDGRGYEVTKKNLLSGCGTFASRPEDVSIGYAYFCTDRHTDEGGNNGIVIFNKGNGIWVDALGRIVE
ncbi:MAG: hypothetical protein IJA46_00330 [Bacteroidaceae bacterium]|nr:hypothetical protein [Bacteroidaceae bacterium]